MQREGTSLIYRLNTSVLEDALTALMDGFGLKPCVPVRTDGRPGGGPTMNIAKPAAVSAVLVVAMLGASAWAWPHSPALIVTHWGADGRPNGWSPRALGLLLTPCVGRRHGAAVRRPAGGDAAEGAGSSGPREPTGRCGSPSCCCSPWFTA